MTISVGNLIVAGGASVDTSEVLSALNKQGLKVWVGTKTQRDALPENVKNDDKITFLTYDSEEDIYLIVDTIISYSKTWSSVKISTELAKKINSSDVYTKTEVMTLINSKVASALKYRGAVATVAALPSTGQENGDSYYVQADGYMYAWSSDYSDWQALGSATDMTNYYTKSEVDALLADMAVKFQYTTMPTADSTTVGKIIQYTGADTNDYKNGYWYKGIDNGDSTYSWALHSIGDYYTKSEIDSSFDKKTELTGVIDLNDYYANGKYIARNGEITSVSNAPSDISSAYLQAGFGLEVFSYGADETTASAFATQIFTAYPTGDLYYRSRSWSGSGFSWSSWSKLATTDWVSVNNYIKHTGKDLSAAGWYKIAKLTPSNYGSSIIVKLTSNYNYYNNAALTFCLSYANSVADCKVLSYCGEKGLFTSIRLIDDYVEVYYAQNAANAVNAIIMISENNAGQTQIENFVADSTATGGIEWALNDIVVATTDDIFHVGDRQNTIGWADLSNSVDIDGSSNYANNVGRIEGHNAIIEVSNPNTGYQWPVTNSGDSNKFMDFGGAIQFFVDKVNNHLYVRFADSVDMSNWGEIVTQSDISYKYATSVTNKQYTFNFNNPGISILEIIATGYSDVRVAGHWIVNCVGTFGPSCQVISDNAQTSIQSCTFSVSDTVLTMDFHEEPYSVLVKELTRA